MALKRIIGILLGSLAILFTALMWSGLSVRELLDALNL